MSIICLIECLIKSSIDFNFFLGAYNSVYQNIEDVVILIKGRMINYASLLPIRLLT